MDKLETFLNVLKEKYNNEIDDEHYKVLGTGHFSLVFDVDGAAYKITTELDYKKQLNLAKNINMLYNLGVNVPYTYCVHSYNDSKMFFDSIKRSAQKNSYKDFIADLKNLIERNHEYYDINRIVNFSGIFQEKITGDVPFNSTAYYIGEAMMLNKEDVEDSIAGLDTVDPAICFWVDRIQDDITKQLDYFLAIPNEHYVKFLQDAFAIHTREIHIDNVTKKNYIYNKEKGFYFIDVGALNYKDILPPERLYWPITCTITNVLNQIGYPKEFFTQETKEKYVQLFIKLHKNLSNCMLQNLSNDRVVEDIKRYMNKIERSSDHYKYYKLFVNELPKSKADKLKKQYGFVKSIIRGNALSSGEEYENN